MTKRLLLRLSVLLIMLTAVSLLWPAHHRSSANASLTCEGTEQCDLCYCDCNDAYTECLQSFPTSFCINQRAACGRDCFCNYCPGGLDYPPGTCQTH